MRNIRVAFLIALALLSASAYAASPPPAGSFLKQRVFSVGDLVTQMSSQKVVASRYTQHFKSNRQSLVAYFQGNLKLSTLHKPTVTTVYYVNKAGKIMRGKRLLPTGTPVFLTKSGVAVLDGRCGNPLRAELPQQPKAIAKTAVKNVKAASGSTTLNMSSSVKVATAKTPKSGNQVVEKVLANNPAEIATLPFATVPTIASEAVAPAMVTAAPAIPPAAVAAVAAAPTTIIPPVIAAAGGFNFLPWAIAGGVGAAAGIAIGGGGGSDNPPPATVPEPASLVTLASGLVGCAAYTLKKRRL